MTRALDVFGPQMPGPLIKANWLGRYLEVERKFDRQLFDMLKEAEKGVVAELVKIQDKDSVSAHVRLLQFKLARKTIRDYVNELFGTKYGKLIKGYQSEAAEAAINASLYEQKGLLAKLFPNTTDRQNYASSLRLTARRNVENAMTRILQTKIPLSQRVYKTKALSNGLIDTTINNALARGDSAANLARDVSSLIKPETPGGVSYAAKRLGRTEINNAFHAQSIKDSQETPWVQQMVWHLSKRHTSDPGDLCESYALTRVFDTERVPEKPHPNCRCFVTPEIPDYDLFETELIQGHYDSYIDKVLSGETYSTASQITIAPSKQPEISIKETVEKIDETNVSQEVREIDETNTPQEVADIMREKYPQVSFADEDWNTKNTTLEAAKSYAHGLDDMMQKYPDNNLQVVAFGVNPEIEYGRTYTSPDGFSAIVFNKRYSLDPKYMQQRMSNDVDTFFHVKGSEIDPYRANAIHEFGHVLDGKHKFQRQKEMFRALTDAFVNISRPDDLTTDNFLTWAHQNILRYGFNGDGTIKMIETVAEAFADVELNGSNASYLSKLMYDILVAK